MKESINFFVVATQFNIENAIVGVRKMLALMWSDDASMKSAVLDAYHTLYLRPDPNVYTTAKVSPLNIGCVLY